MDMKKSILILLALSTVSTAAADSLGLSGAFQKGFYRADGEAVDVDGSAAIGVSYTYDLDSVSSVRAELELLPNLYGSEKLGFGGEFTYLRSVFNDGAANVYVGGGLGLNTVSETADGATVRLTGINPTALAGVNYAVAPGFAAYLELAGGVSFLRGSVSNGSASVSTSATGAFIKPRIGVTYNLR